MACRRAATGRPSRAEWHGNEIALYAEQPGQLFVTRLDARTGKVLGQEKQPFPDLLRRVIAPDLAASQVQALQNSLWQIGVDNPPFNRRLLATYTSLPELKLLAFKKPDRDSRNRGETGDQPVQVYSEAAGKVIFRFQTVGYDSLFSSDMSDELNQLSFSPDGRYLGWSATGRVTIWELKTGNKVAVLRPQPYSSSFSGPRVNWAADSRSVTLSGSDWLREYALPDGKLLRGQDVREGFQTFSTHWDFATGVRTALRVQTAGGKSCNLGRSAGGIFFSDTDRSFISFTDDRTAWFYPSGQSRAVQLHLNRPMRVENARLNSAAGTVDLFGQLLTPPDPKGQANTPPPVPAVQRFSLAAALRAGPDITSTATLKEVAHTKESNSECEQGKPPQKGRWWVSPAFTLHLCETPSLITARLLNADPESRPLWTLGKVKGIDSRPQFSPDDRILLLPAADREVKVSHARNAALLATLRVPGQGPLYVYNFRLRPDERTLALQIEGVWHFYDLRTKQELPAPAAIKGARDLAFVENGATLAVQQDSAVVFYSLK